RQTEADHPLRARLRRPRRRWGDPAECHADLRGGAAGSAVATSTSARAHQGLQTPGYQRKNVPEGATPPTAPFRGRFFPLARDFNPWWTERHRANSLSLGRGLGRGRSDQIEKAPPERGLSVFGGGREQPYIVVRITTARRSCSGSPVDSAE